MKNFLKSLIPILIVQLMCWGVFIIISETTHFYNMDSEKISSVVGIICLIGVLTLYFINAKKYAKKLDINLLKLNITWVILWDSLAIAIGMLLVHLTDIGVLHICNETGIFACFLDGIEYALYAVSMVQLSIIVILLNLICWIYIKIRNKK